MITDRDVEKLKETFATKVEFKEHNAQLEDRFDKMFMLIYQMQNQINEIREEARAFRDQILTHVDKYMKQGEDYRQEHIMPVSQVDRHDRWINKITAETDVELK